MERKISSMSSIHELLKQVYPLKLRMELFNAIWINWRADIKEKDQQITNLQNQLAITEKALELAVEDKCKFENALLSTSLGIEGGKVAVPKKEQYYIEQAKERLENE